MIQKISMNSNRAVKISNMKFIINQQFISIQQTVLRKSSIIYEIFNFNLKIVY